MYEQLAEISAPRGAAIAAEPMEAPMLLTPWLNPLGMGRTVVECHGRPVSGYIVVSHNNTSADLLGGELMPPDLAPDLRPLSTMAGYAVPAAGREELVLSLPLAPGLMAYYQDLGLIRVGQVIEVEPGSNGFGHAQSDPLALLEARGSRFDTPSLFVATFPTFKARADAIKLGLDVVQLSDPWLTSNKWALRMAAAEYGFRVAPGLELRESLDLTRAEAMFEQSSRAWLKLAHGAGGDTVIPIGRPINEEAIREGIERLRAAVTQAFEKGGFSPEAHEIYWPKASFAPKLSHLTIEEDLGEQGEVLGNYSNTVCVNSNGTYSVPAYFRQIVSGGNFIGSEPVELSAEHRQLMDCEMAKIACYCRDKLCHFGMIGIDFFLIRTPGGEVQPFIIEMNGRPSNSTTALMVAQKLQAPHWINVKLHSREAINTCADFEKAVTFGGSNHARAALSDGLIVPTILDPVWTHGREGAPKLLSSGHTCRVLITSNRSQAHCHQLLRELYHGEIFVRENTGNE